MYILLYVELRDKVGKKRKTKEQVTLKCHFLEHGKCSSRPKREKERKLDNHNNFFLTPDSKDRQAMSSKACPVRGAGHTPSVWSPAGRAATPVSAYRLRYRSAAAGNCSLDTQTSGYSVSVTSFTNRFQCFKMLWKKQALWEVINTAQENNTA